MRPLSLLCLAAALPGVYGQAPQVDRSWPPGQNAVKLGVPQGFLGDHFVLGARGEVWIADRLAVWAVVEPNRQADRRLGDLYESVKLLGGIEAELPAPGQPAPPDCACHNLAVLKSAALRTGKDAAETDDVRIFAAAPGVWRIEFQDVRWSVPGGVPIQFGVLWTERPGTRTQQRSAWFNSAGAGADKHDLRRFDENGRLLGRYEPESGRLDPAIGFHVQVWGHRSDH